MPYLVTGGGGFIGASVVKALLAIQESVVVYDREIKSNALSRALSARDLSNVVRIEGDIADSAKISTVLRRHKVTHIIHMASPLSHMTERDACMAETAMCLAQAQIFEAARKLEVQKIVWTSSVAVFGPASRNGDFVHDDAPHDPQSLYGACKSHCEYLAHHYFDKHGVDSIGLRLATVYGPYRQRGAFMFLNELMANPAAGIPCVIPFGDEVFNWQYVDDVAELVVKASTTGRTSRRVFNTTGDFRSMREAVSIVKKLCPHAEIAIKAGRTEIPWLTKSRFLHKEIGYRFPTRLSEGLRRSILTLREQLKLAPA